MTLLNSDVDLVAKKRAADGSWQARVKETSPLTGAKILIADKGTTSQKHIKDEMSGLNAEQIDVVSSITDLHRALRDGKYSIVFVDNSLSEDNGTVMFEELAAKNLIKKSTCFFAVTDDTFGPTILAISESGPDKILTKPFSLDYIAKRTVGVFARKASAKRMLHCYDKKDVKGLETSYQDICLELPMYKEYATHVLIDGHMEFGSKKRASGLIDAFTKGERNAKFETYIAQILVADRKLSEAEDHLRRCLSYFQSYLPASDLLADVLWSLGKKEDALSLLEQLGVSAQSNSSRLRTMADLAQEIGNEQKYRTYLTKVIDRTVGSGMANEDDFYRLADLFLEQKRTDEALAIASKIKKVSGKNNEKDVPDLVILAKSFFLAENQEKAIELVESIIGKNDISLGDLSPGTLLAVAELCFECNMKSTAINYCKALMNKGISRGMKERIKKNLSSFDFETMIA